MGVLPYFFPVNSRYNHKEAHRRAFFILKTRGTLTVTPGLEVEMKRIMWLFLLTGLWLLAACSPAAGGDAVDNTNTTTDPDASPTQALDLVTLPPEATPEPPTVEVAVTNTIETTATTTVEATPNATATLDSPNVPDDGSGMAEIRPSDLVITFTQEGGIMGLQVELVIDSSGRVTQNGTVITELTYEEMDHIYQTLINNDFFTLAPDYQAEDICCDFFVYTLTVHANSETTAVRTVGGPPDTPEWLWNALQPFIALAEQGMTNR